jgi:hypothetical protein
MVDQKQGVVGKHEEAGKSVVADVKANAGTLTANDTAANAVRDAGYADEDGTGDGNLQAYADRQGCDRERHHREVHRRGEADEGWREHLLPDDQGQARADGQEVNQYSPAYFGDGDEGRAGSAKEF